MRAGKAKSGTGKRETKAVDQGRESFRRKAWAAAFSQLSAADNESPLGPVDLVLLGQAAQLIGKEVEGTDLLVRAHQAFVDCGENQPAARCAFWLGFIALLRGETATAGGWLARAGRLVEGVAECVEKGYLLLPAGYKSFHEGDAKTAFAMFAAATSTAEQFGDKDLMALGLQGQGRALIRQGEIARGVELLDEAMVAVTAGEVSPLNAGGVYCSVLDACGEIFDLRRAQEWTLALERWCAAQPDLVPYRGHCLIRRAELLQLHGAWDESLEEAKKASEWLARTPTKAGVATALYQMGEIFRLRGQFVEAESAYQRASELRSCPGPGLALLCLAQNQKEAAKATIRRMEKEIRAPGPRARVLDAFVEVALAGNEIDVAHAASEELREIATRHDIPFLRALACRATGAVHLAEGQAEEGLVHLRGSWALWSELQVPYEAARDRVLIALACRKLADEENAVLELTAAKESFARLGATVDLKRVEQLMHGGTDTTSCPLTEREIQILRLVASGLSNRGIATQLKISEKTVARHLSNIFTKLDLNSRTAAAAYAYEHDLV
jgi:ATP/maltotriose-dependent transcriptional regulator MalT